MLKTPPGTSEFEAYRDETAAPPALVVQVGKTEVRYHLNSAIDAFLQTREGIDTVLNCVHLFLIIMAQRPWLDYY